MSLSKAQVEWWRSRKRRNCMTAFLCVLCHKVIFMGDPYFDGGGKKRAHPECVK